MAKQQAAWENAGFVLRSARREDAEAYYRQNYCPLDPEIARLTGCRPEFFHDEVTGFFLACLEDESRYDFLILAPAGNIIGESVLNEIDPVLRSANFRIAIFHSEACGRGIGSWAIRQTCGFGFDTLGLHRISLDVFAFNRRALRAYRKAGFRQEGVLRDAVLDGGRYADDILMSMLEQDWQAMQGRPPAAEHGKI